MTLREIFEGLAALPVALKELRDLQQMGSVTVAHITPGDAIVIETDASLSHEGRQQITKSAQSIFPGTKVVILDSGFHMSIVKSSGNPFPPTHDVGGLERKM